MKELVHYGIRGQKWGKRNGPPYPLSGSDYSATERRFMGKKDRNEYTESNKRHFDSKISRGQELATLSFDKNRTKNTDMFYAAIHGMDRDRYMAMFNTPVKDIGTGEKVRKYLIVNKARKNLNIASEDSSVDAFRELVKKDRDFSNFVFDKNRMESAFAKDQYKYSAYRRSKSTLDKTRKPDHKLTDADLREIYKMFNYIIPSDGHGDARLGADVKRQRTKFFKLLKSKGYSGLLDANDSLYNHIHAKRPVVMFDMQSMISSSVRRTKMSEVNSSRFRYFFNKILGR